MFQKILLPVDLTDKHQHALEMASSLAQPGDGEIVLLHVIEIIPGLPLEEEKEFYQRLQHKADQFLKRLAERLPKGKARSRPEITFGNRPREILHYAADKKCDLIVLTSPVFDPNNLSVGFGSLSFKLSLLARCPVLLVR